MNIKWNRKIIYWLLPLFGVAFLLWYIKNATCDVVYSDYVRLVNSYLPDVCNPAKFFVPDVLTRIPVNYLERIINVKLFGFSLTFDRVLGVLSLGLAAAAFAAYSLRHKISTGWFALLMCVMFSLNKWEMLTNGSGWSHFFAFACFYYHELVFDRFQSGNGKKRDGVKLLLLPWVIILGTAGPYCAIYAVVMLMGNGYCFVRGLWEKNAERTAGKAKGLDYRYALFGACVLVPLLLYILSNSFAVEEHAGATGRSLMTILLDFPSFPFRFLLKSLAGMIVGGEELQRWVQDGVIANQWCYVLGLFVAAGYVLALWMNLYYKLYKKTLFPLLLLVGGALNHVLIFFSRYIFEKENYALSSRYALQFQVGILGIILTFALVSQLKGHRGRPCPGLCKGAMALLCVAILAGNGYTTYREIRKAPYREENFEKMALTAPELPAMSDEQLQIRGKELDGLYEYRKGTQKIRQAFIILEENGLNVFRK